jgi:hypothetical protein
MEMNSRDNAGSGEEASFWRRTRSIINVNNGVIIGIFAALAIYSLGNSSFRNNGLAENSLIPTRAEEDHCSVSTICLPPIECAICPSCPVIENMPPPPCPNITCSSCPFEEYELVVVELNSTCQELENANSQILRLRSQLASSDEFAEKLTEKMHESELKWRETSNVLESSKVNLNNLENELNAANTYVSDLQQEISEFRNTARLVITRLADQMFIESPESIIDGLDVHSHNQHSLEFLAETKTALNFIQNEMDKILVKTKQELSADISDMIAIAVEKAVIEIENNCTKDPPESEVIEDSIPEEDFALQTAGATVILERTSPSYFPKELRFDSKLKNMFELTGFGDIVEYTPSLSFESFYRWLDLPANVGSPSQILNRNLAVGSCWPMQVGVTIAGDILH